MDPKISPLQLKNEDCNTKFFSVFVSRRKHHNKISAIIDDNGIIHSYHHGISKCFADFYSLLWTSSNPSSMDELHVTLPNDHIGLNESDKVV